ncbi:hypothetical protein COLO4_07108 [Corchorus olitorius]|uniref:DUF761 domain-containing protein n=1 Tax=Corchorus olitorius TaxID=93759 RepID=A0A1R3KKW1_9ROSI|nr:hypothetical protein COLO4_07108 [Corchorus olitorius]
MKNKASVMFKQIISLVWGSSVTKAKSMAVKGKMSAAKARLILFTLMKSKKSVFLGSISNKIHGLLGSSQEDDDDIIDINAKAIVPYNMNIADEEDDDKYPDLRHCLFEEADELELQAAAEAGSIIDMVRNSKEEGGEDFSLEDEIDHVADLFITRFYKQMRLQKLLSFKRHQEMLQKSG